MTVNAIKTRLVILHILCWILFILQGILPNRIISYDAETVIFYPINILSFYGFIELLANFHAWSPNTYIRRIVKITGLFSALIILKFAINYMLGGTSKIRTHWNFDLSSTFYFLIMAIVYRAVSFFIFYSKRETEAKTALLEQRVQPYLWFNTLNFIHNAVERNSQHAGKAINLLSDLTRYGLDAPPSPGWIAVNEEVVKIRQLIELNQLCCGDVLLNVFIDQFGKDCNVPALVLLSLVENMFKHGDFSKIEQPGRILLVQQDKLLIFETSNRCREQAGAGKIGTGLKNICLRLDLAYGKQYILQTSFEGSSFNTRLILPI